MAGDCCRIDQCNARTRTIEFLSSCVVTGTVILYSGIRLPLLVYFSHDNLILAVSARPQRHQVDRYRLRIPFRVSEESPDYVSTDEPMSHPRRRKENGDGGSVAVDWADADEDNSEVLESSGGRYSDSMEIDEVEVGNRGVSMRQDRDESDASGEEEEEEEEGEIDEEEEEGAVVGPIAFSSAGHAPPQHGESEAGRRASSVTAPGEREVAEEEVGGRGPETPGGKRNEEEEGEVGPSEASILTGANDGLLEADSASLDGGEDGAIVLPPRSSVVDDSERSCGRESSAPPARTFVPPPGNLLCPIPSGPAKGAVMLGLDCEMVSE